MELNFAVRKEDVVADLATTTKMQRTAQEILPEGVLKKNFEGFLAET